MYDITLISSFHKEIGKCNPDELYRIIKEIQPEIIFEELPISVFKVIYADGYNPESLEAKTIKKYLGVYPIEHIPVDTFEMNIDDTFGGFDFIAEKSIEYTELLKKQLSQISRYGYSFLNSDSSNEMLHRIKAIEEKVLSDSHEHALLQQYMSDREPYSKRESEMLQNIYNYSKLHRYEKAIFICGAEHRKSIIQKILEIEGRELLKLNWTFYKVQDFYNSQKI